VADEREINVLFPLFVCGQLASSLLGRAIEGSGLTTAEFGVLSAIGVWGPLSPGELAQRVGMPPTTLSDYVSRFTRRRLVKRRPHPQDGRSYLLELTAEGRRRHQRAGAGLLRTLDEIAANLERPAREVRESLLQLEAALRAGLAPIS
jgi:DNA-binding MarR family transcriptional regulator